MKRVFRAAWMWCIATAAAAQMAPAPTIVSPTAGVVVDDDAPLLWNAVPGATRYDVELCGDAACAEVLGRSSVPNLYSLIRRPLGTLYWRVATVDASGARGAWSPVIRFTVAHGISGTVFEDLNGDNDAAGLSTRMGRIPRSSRPSPTSAAPTSSIPPRAARTGSPSTRRASPPRPARPGRSAPNRRGVGAARCASSSTAASYGAPATDRASAADR